MIFLREIFRMAKKNINYTDDLCSVKIIPDDVTVGDIFIAIDSNKYDLNDGALGFTNNEDSVLGLGGTISLEKNINIAFKNGARFIFVDNEKINKEMNNSNIILIDDCMKFLIEIAKYIVNKNNIKTIAITGSTGKTTTTYAIYNMLSIKYNVVRIHRIRNSVLGMIYEIINNINYETDFLVIEMQLDGKGQIDCFCKICKPDYSIITSINYSHYSRFKKIENIFHEKLAVYRNLKPDGKCLINGDDKLLMNWANKQKDNRILTFGFSELSDFYIHNLKQYGILNNYIIDLDGQLKIDGLITNINNKGMLQAYLYAIYLAKKFDVDNCDILEKICKTVNPIGRFNGFRGINGALIIDDSYNANSTSMINGLEYINNLKRFNNKIVILGSLLELEKETENEHIKVGNYIIKNCDFSILITLGEGASYIANQVRKYGICVESFFDYEDILDYVNNISVNETTVVYIKGSGGMRMELIAMQFLSNRLF